MDSVTQSTQASLRDLGIVAVVTQQGDDVRLGWRDSKGSKLAFVLTSVKTPKGEATRVRFDGAKGTDPQLGQKVIADLEARHGTAA